MHHLAAYTAVVANTADLDVAALTDDVLLIQNNHFVPRQDLELIAAWGGSATLNRFRLAQPTIRQITTPYVRPTNVGVTPLSRPPVADYRREPFKIYPNEELQVQVTSDVAMTERFTALVWLRPRYVAPPAGSPFTMRGTSTTAATANAWSSLAVTWQDTPKSGIYAVVGLTVFSANGIASRLIFEDQQLRPGALSVTAIGNIEHEMFHNAGLGEFGRFDAYRFPIVQVLANGADATHVIHMDIVRVSGIQ